MNRDLLWLVTTISLLMMLVSLAWALSTTIGELDSLEATVTAMQEIRE